MPIFAAGRPLGLLWLEGRAPGAVSSGALALARIAATELGLWLRAKQAEEVVQAREQRLDLEHQHTEDLERSNRDLGAFAALAAHDLQEPLRKIVIFADRVQLRHASGLDDKGRDYLTRIQGAGRRMQNLIRDILTYSQADQGPARRQPVNLTTVARQVLSDLGPALEGQARVDIGPLPTIDADPGQMGQLFQNLIGNALKFHAPDRPTLITVRSERVGGILPARDVWLIFVEDNGIGFDPAEAERIFGMLQRLHGRTAYEGSGMGLAICRRIVEGHGGTITAHGDPGRGATFLITLPALARKAPPDVS